MENKFLTRLLSEAIVTSISTVIMVCAFIFLIKVMQPTYLMGLQVQCTIDKTALIGLSCQKTVLPTPEMNCVTKMVDEAEAN